MARASAATEINRSIFIRTSSVFESQEGERVDKVCQKKSLASASLPRIAMVDFCDGRGKPGFSPRADDRVSRRKPRGRWKTRASVLSRASPAGVRADAAGA